MPLPKKSIEEWKDEYYKQEVIMKDLGKQYESARVRFCNIKNRLKQAKEIQPNKSETDK